MMAAWRPGLQAGGKRRFTSPEMSVASDSVFVVPVPAVPHARPAGRTARPLGHARYVWNLAVEQYAHWRPGRASAPGDPGQVPAAHRRPRRLSVAGRRRQTVQQQALRDFTQARAAFADPDNPALAADLAQGRTRRGIPDHRAARTAMGRPPRVPQGRPGLDTEGRLVRFRWSRPVPPVAKSYRVTTDRAGRWHIAFAVIPDPIPAPGNGQAVGIDRGVTVSAALSTGGPLHAPALTGPERRRVQRKLARARRGSNRRGQVRHAIARLRARESDRRRDRAEKASTGIARRFDLIRVEDLEDREHDPVGQGDGREPGPERAGQGLRTGDPAVGLGPAGAPGWRTRRPAGCRRSNRRLRASAVRRAGRWMRTRVRAKRGLCARPVDTPATLM